MTPLLSIDILLIAVCAWLAIGLAGLAAPRNLRFVGKMLFPLGALVGVLTGLTSLAFLGGSAEVAVLAIGLPNLPFHLRLDNLTAVFALLVGMVSAGISVFAAGYFREGEGTAPGLMSLQYHFFLASMLMVLLADDAYAFMVAWEVMALSSFFLVTTDHKHAEIRRAGYLYLLVAHIGGRRFLHLRRPLLHDFFKLFVTEADPAVLHHVLGDGHALESQGACCDQCACQQNFQSIHITKLLMLPK